MDTPPETKTNRNIIGIMLILAGIAAAFYHWVYQPLFPPKTTIPPTNTPATGQNKTTTPSSKPAASPTTGAIAPQPAFTSSVQVAIRGFSFVAENTQVKVGTKITWTNFDTAGHTVTSDTGVFTSKILSQGKSFEYIFNKPGTYPYHCVLHPDIKGSIVVLP